MKRFAMAGRLAGGTGAIGVDDSLLRQQAAPETAARASLAAGELWARVAIVALFTFMAMRIGADYIHTGRITGLLLVASEALVVVLTVFRRPPLAVDRSVQARIVTGVSLVGPSLVMPAAVAALLPAIATVAISAAGLLVVISGKLSLGRSFGLMPANRGVVSTGIYRLVRHPIYLGYLITHAGFLAANPTIWNVLTLGATDVVLLIRAVCEERTLARDVRYQAYQTQVRWRVLPGVF
jgi:protein-S-isoprenylcysteine O-methyltransferase Ste14